MVALIQLLYRDQLSLRIGDSGGKLRNTFPEFLQMCLRVVKENASRSSSFVERSDGGPRVLHIIARLCRLQLSDTGMAREMCP